MWPRCQTLERSVLPQDVNDIVVFGCAPFPSRYIGDVRVGETTFFKCINRQEMMEVRFLPASIAIVRSWLVVNTTQFHGIFFDDQRDRGKHRIWLLILAPVEVTTLILR